MGTRLGDKHPTRLRRVQGELNFEEIPSSVQDSEILGSWMRTKHKWKAMGSASYPEAGIKGTSTGLYPSHGSLRFITSRSPLPCEKRSDWGGWLRWDGANFITLENKHVVISWSSASISDNLAPVLQLFKSWIALQPLFGVFQAPLSQFITVTYPRRTSRPRDPKFGRAK